MIRLSLLAMILAVGCQSSSVTDPATSIDDFRAQLERLRIDGHIQAISAVIKHYFCPARRSPQALPPTGAWYGPGGTYAHGPTDYAGCAGTGNDGALGIHEIKSSGGITFAQDDSAQQSTMPRNAVASGGVDFVLAPEAMAIEIARIARHPFARPGPSRAVPVTDDPAIGRLFEILRRDTGIEFAEYRRNTINRRILRRMGKAFVAKCSRQSN